MSVVGCTQSVSLIGAVPPQCLMAGRLLKVSSVATALVATSGVYLYTKQLDPNDLSLVRFGRAAAAVSGTL